MSSASNDVPDGALVQRHLRFGWVSLLVFLTLGIVLDALHGFKIGWYLDVSNSMRRLMWTLAHAHGVLFGLVHIAYGFSLRLPGFATGSRLTSPSLVAASLLVPGGFFLGGLYIYDGDPGLGVFLVPVGALLLLFGVLQIALASLRYRA